jgi:phosphoribosylglycinamide formyltransferase 2
MGYVGHFDLDCLVDEEGKLYLLEVNSRRTGGTHVHDFAQHVIGPDYMDKVALLSYEAMDACGIQSADELLETVGEFLYPMNGDPCRGLVVTITTALRLGRFGCIAVAPTIEEAVEIQNRVANRVKKHSETHV